MYINGTPTDFNEEDKVAHSFIPDTKPMCILYDLEFFEKNKELVESLNGKFQIRESLEKRNK